MVQSCQNSKGNRKAKETAPNTEIRQNKYLNRNIRKKRLKFSFCWFYTNAYRLVYYIINAAVSMWTWVTASINCFTTNPECCVTKLGLQSAGGDWQLFAWLHVLAAGMQFNSTWLFSAAAYVTIAVVWSLKKMHFLFWKWVMNCLTSAQHQNIHSKIWKGFKSFSYLKVKKWLYTGNIKPI